MNYILFHLWGPFSIHSYGLCIALAVALFTTFVQRDPRFMRLQLEDVFHKILGVGIAAAIFFGKFLYLISEASDPQLIDLFRFWEGGFSVLGSTIGVLLVIPWYIHSLNIPLLPFFDLIALYAGLLQGIGRVGCFFAGCCFGAPSHALWAVRYHDPLCSAPLDTWLHPTQLYSAALLIAIYFLMTRVIQYRVTSAGQLGAIYLMLASAERFVTDFMRDDRIISTSFLSYHQWVALGIIAGAALFYKIISMQRWPKTKFV